MCTGVGLQPVTRQDKTKVGKGSPQFRYHTKNCLLRVLNMARTKKEEIRQKKGHGRTDETYFIVFHKTIAFSVSKMKNNQFLILA